MEKAVVVKLPLKRDLTEYENCLLVTGKLFYIILLQRIKSTPGACFLQRVYVKQLMFRQNIALKHSCQSIHKVSSPDIFKDDYGAPIEGANPVFDGVMNTLQTTFNDRFPDFAATLRLSLSLSWRCWNCRNQSKIVLRFQGKYR